jgi:hypothetical protein
MSGGWLALLAMLGVLVFAHTKLKKLLYYLVFLGFSLEYFFRNEWIIFLGFIFWAGLDFMAHTSTRAFASEKNPGEGTKLVGTKLTEKIDLKALFFSVYLFTLLAAIGFTLLGGQSDPPITRTLSIEEIKNAWAELIKNHHVIWVAVFSLWMGATLFYSYFLRARVVSSSEPTKEQL